MQLARAGMVCLALAALPGCKASVEQQGHTGTLAKYSGGVLSADLASTVRVQAVIAAAESAMRDRGYTIGARRASEDSGFVEAKLPRPGLFERTQVSSKVTAGGTRVSVKVEPWGDEAASRAILDDVLKRLGL